MLFSFLSQSITVKRSTLQEILDTSKEGTNFIMAAPSDDFEFSEITRAFIRAAHLSYLDAKYMILDTSVETVEPSVFNVTQFPAVIYVQDGRTFRSQYRGFDEEYILGFINSNAIGPFETIETKDELMKFYSTTSFALLIAKDVHTEGIDQFRRDHFHEITVAYVNPSLMDKEGFYVYKYNDATLIPIEDISEMEERQIAEAVYATPLPEFMKLNSMVAGMYEDQSQMYVVLMLVMDDFYLNNEHLELARAIKEQTGLNVTYADVENNQVIGFKYGLPDSLDSTMAIIDARDYRVYKYMLTEELNKENAIKLVENVKAGSVKPFWKSEVDGTKPGEDGLLAISANQLVDMINNKQTFIMTVHFSNQEEVEVFAEASKILSKVYGKDTTLGKFSIALNDWSGDIVEFEEFPYIVIYKEGKIIYSGAQGKDVEAICKQVNDAFAKDSNL